MRLQNPVLEKVQRHGRKPCFVSGRCLNDADFVKRAPEEIIDGEREKREEAEDRRAKILEALERLKGAA